MYSCKTSKSTRGVWLPEAVMQPGGAWATILGPVGESKSLALMKDDGLGV